ncbi:MAG: tetratricopeptide repeat protein [Gammaproteobacteria bacterium]
MIKNRNVVALGVLVAFTAGCAAPRAEPEPEPEPPKGAPAALTVVAEIALERGDCRTATETYLDAAARGDATVAKRATEVALECNHLPGAWKAAQRWRTLAPADRDAVTIYSVIAFKLHRVGEARGALAWLVGDAASAASEGAVIELIALLAKETDSPSALFVIAPLLEGRALSANVLAVLGELALDAWSFDRAERYARRAVEVDPGNVPARRVLGRVHAARGDSQAAITIARELAQSDPERSRFELVETLAALDRLEESRLELERLRTAEVPDGEIDRRLAVLAYEGGDLAEAQRRFVELVASGEGREASLFYLADIAARDGDAETAIAGYRRLADSSLALAARARAADLLMARNERPAALALFDDYASDHPDRAFDTMLAKARLLADHGESGTAIELLDAALERFPEHPSLQYERAVMLERAGRVRDAVGGFERMLRERPDDPTMLNALGYTLADNKLELARAEGLIRRALGFSPDSPATLDSLGWVRFRRGDTRGALPVLERAWQIGRDAEIAAHFGEAQWVAGRQQDARRTWASALARHPDSAALKATIGRFVPPEKP